MLTIVGLRLNVYCISYYVCIAFRLLFLFFSAFIFVLIQILDKNLQFVLDFIGLINLTSIVLYLDFPFTILKYKFYYYN